VSRTHDQDSDADLWKDGFFGRKVTRYLCLSKKQGLPGLSDYIVEAIAVVNDKEVPPDGYTLLPRTIDSGEFFFYLWFVFFVCAAMQINAHYTH
jgi:ESCRT-I complex subunit MVB12